MSAAEQMAIVPPPERGIYRCSRGTSPFEFPDWAYADDDGTFGNRFDDPTPILLNKPAQYRTLYCATQRIATLGETLARFRVRPGLVEALRQIDDDEETTEDALNDVRDPLYLDHGLIGNDWIRKRRIGHTYIDADCRFVDLGSHVTIAHLNRVFAPFLDMAGVSEIDLSRITSGHRLLTQAIALYSFLQGYAGVRYVSRLDASWECWALFEGSFRFEMGEPRGFHAGLTPDDPDLLEIARAFSLSIEFTNSHILRPWQMP
ncbi:MAG: hypothetical protein ACTHQE_06155 [Thermomicrobiales bacterium]